MSRAAPETSDSETPIVSTAQLVAYVASGAKPKDEWRIGTEHEKFPFLRPSCAPLPYAGEQSIEALLEGLRQRFGWVAQHEQGKLVALSSPDGRAGISLEPAGQFELSGAALDSLHDTQAELAEHFAQLRAVGDPLGIGFLALGASPLWTRAETPAMPLARYAIMAPCLMRSGSRGLDTMFRTATVQVNLDFGSEADMVQKLRVALALQPVATALFANSPFLDGRPSGFLSTRSEMWRDTDPARCGMFPPAFEPGFGFERYVDHALGVPMWFVVRGGRYIDTAGQSFRAFMQGRLPQLPGERPVLKDWANHLSTIFHEARLRRYIEMRGADSGPLPRLSALPALWTGLLYHQPSLDAAWDLVKDWTAEERQALRDEVPRRALQAMVRGRTVQALAQDVLSLARTGLAARNRRNGAGKSEAIYLDHLDEIAASGRSPAETLLARFRQTDLKSAFAELAY